ncbi:BQ5605_C004g03115 [Microbotryum silenes-dioicae]|uniref:BQ5605_C004g03115 protein n=1 Tax=Microbotryum silenes-dioicae TaxID=796604 RepID=A0A2X0PC20_9BASI|nr:BQ5605_C004g03115 [Microbotryum silenes-dioicae]
MTSDTNECCTIGEKGFIERGRHGAQDDRAMELAQDREEEECLLRVGRGKSRGNDDVVRSNAPRSIEEMPVPQHRVSVGEDGRQTEALADLDEGNGDRRWNVGVVRIDSMRVEVRKVC